NNRLIERVSGIQKLMMTVAASAAIAVPVVAGVLGAPHAYAQAEGPGGAAPDVSTKLMQPHFKDADITLVAEAVSAGTGRSFIIDPRVQGQVTMITTTPLSPQTFYEAFLNVLEVYGFKAEPDGQVTKIVLNDDAHVRPGTGLPDEVSSNSNFDELVTGVF